LVYLHQGNKEEGEQKLQAALRLNPNDSEAKELLRSLHSASLKF
jgi:Flp pilus assembly protein TadD